MDRERLDGWCEKGILALVLAILVFGPLALGAVPAINQAILLGLLVPALLLWAARFWLRARYRMLLPPVCGAILLVLGYGFAIYRYAPVEYLARQEILQMLACGLLFFLVLDNLNRQEFIQTIAFVLIFLGMVIALYAVYQFLSGSERVWWFPQHPGYRGRASGTYYCPNHLAGFLEMVLPIALAYTLTGRLKPTTKVLLGYAASVIIAGIGVTVSKGGWIATALSLLLFFGILLFNRDHRLPAICFLILLMVAGTLFAKKAYTPQKRFQAMSATPKVDGTRWEFSEAAIQIWHDHFWWGGGPGHYDYLFRRYRPWNLQTRPLYAHNDYVNTLADWGFVGAALIGLTFVILFWGVFRVWKFVGRTTEIATKPSNRSAIVLGASIGLVALLLHSAVDFNMHIPANALTAVTLMALITGHFRHATERFWFNPKLIGKLLATFIVLAAAIYIGNESFRLGLASQLVKKADRQKPGSVEQVALLQRAHDIEPKNFETTYKLGEALRLESWKGFIGYETQAEEAIKWFKLGALLNPLDPYNFIRWGMCLDWLKKSDEALKYYKQALELDPNNYYLQALTGWHFFQMESYAKAKYWLERSVQYYHNDLPQYYLDLTNAKLEELRQLPGNSLLK